MDQLKYHHLLVSVIIPTFNSELTIQRCLRSIIAQSYKNLEIVIVDDHSSDNSIDLSYKELTEFKNFKIIQTEGEKGPGGTRNIGLEAISGDFVCFVDSDDWIDTMMIEKLLESIIRSNAEISICGVITEYTNPKLASFRYRYDLENTITGAFALELLSRTLNLDISISPIVTNKIYQTSFLISNKINFIEGRNNEDDVFTFKCFLHSKKISITPNTYYHYFQHQDSMTKKFGKAHIDDLIFSFEHLKSYLIDLNTFEKYEVIYFTFFEKCLSFVINNMVNAEPSKNIQIEYLTYLMNSIHPVAKPEEIIRYLGATRFKNFIVPHSMK